MQIDELAFNTDLIPLLSPSQQCLSAEGKTLSVPVISIIMQFTCYYISSITYKRYIDRT